MQNKRLITFSKLYSKFIERVNEKYDFYEKIRLTKLKEIKSDVFGSLILYSFMFGIFAIAAIKNVNDLNKHFGDLIGLLIAFLLAFIITYFCFTFHVNNEYRKQMKSLLLPLLLDGIKDLRINKDLKPRWEETSAFQIKINDSKNNYTIYDDSFIGIYNNTSFKISEICNKTRFRGLEQRNFIGIIATFDFNNEFAAKVKLSDKEFPSINQKNANLIGYILIIAFAVIGCIMSATMKKWWIIFPISFALILFFNMVIPSLISFIWNISIKAQNFQRKREFMDNFTVKTDNEIEACSLITPAFMKKLKYLRKKFKAKNLECIIQNKRVMLYLKTNKDCFEIWDVYKPLVDKNLIQDFYYELTTILKIIDYFKDYQETQTN